MNTKAQAASAAAQNVTEKPDAKVALLAGLLNEVRENFTRDDDLPNDLLPRIDEALKGVDAGESALAP